MSLKIKILLALLATSAVVAQDNCKEKYPEDDKENTGCVSCIDGPYYRKDVTPEPAPSSEIFSLYQLEQTPKVWNCIKCPENAATCKFEEKKVVVLTCEAKFYVDTAPAETNDSCKACPANSLSCKKENERVVVTECEAKFYANIPETGNDTCDACPANSKGCSFDAATKKIVIKDGDCDAKFYIGSNDKGNICSQCPVALGCTQCADDKVCKAAEKDQCEKGFYKDANNCPKCEGSCAECSAKDKCSKCSDDSVYLEADKCIKCSETLTGCKSCSAKDKCTACEDAKLTLKDSGCAKSGGLMKWVIIILLVAAVAGVAVFLIKKKSESENKASLMMSTDHDD